MRTARTVEAEWRLVLGEIVSTGAEEDELSTGRVSIGLLYFTVTARSALALVFKLVKPAMSLNLQFIFSDRNEPRILNQWILIKLNVR
jgi:hypothetical protein